MAETVPNQDALGESEAFMEFQRRLGRAARVDRSVLVIGERGSGKELAASRLHFLSQRWNQPFVALNCSVLPPGLIESELFGHEAGAFTGATGSRKGRFEEAHGGTLFLDEIGLIPIEVQEKILRAVEYGTFQRVGSSRTIEVDVRIIGATNQDLQTMTVEGSFKPDLLDRLSFEVLFLPPLRVRGEDVLLLAEHFARRMARELERTGVPVLSDDLKDRLCSYPWPGNVRELKNAVERAVYREDGHIVDKIDLDPFRNPWDEERSSQEDQARAAKLAEVWPRDLAKARRDLESRWIHEAMTEAEGHQGRAAELLGLSYDQFRGLYRKYQDEDEETA